MYFCVCWAFFRKKAIIKLIMFDFLHNFLPSPVFFEWGVLTIRYYGLFIVLGAVLAILVALDLAKKRRLKNDDVIDLALWLILFGIIGARFYEVLILEPNYFFSNPQEIFKIWRGGLAIHGAIIFGLLTIFVWCYYKKQKFWHWVDLVAVVLPLGQALGRFGNYFNQEVFGKPTDLPWGIPIELSNRPDGWQQYQYFHPTFLYESVANFLLFFILWRLYKKQKLNAGQYGACYLFGYGLIRFFLEFIRLESTAMIGDYRWPQIFSIFLMIIGLIIFSYNKKTPTVMPE